MHIIVCIKQVPGTSEVEMDAETGVLKRDNIPAKLNPYDLFALEAAFGIRERQGGTVTALTMGPPAAKAALLETMYMGADRGVLLSDRRFAGADVMATSYTLSQGIRTLGEYDLILCGKQTTDGDTAQVGPELAEFLDVPHSSNITELLGVDGRGITVRMVLDTQVAEQRVALPCVLCVEKDINTPRLPSFRRKQQFMGRQVLTLGLDDLPDRDERRYGLCGSPTQVERIFPPPETGAHETVEGDQACAVALLEVLDAHRLI